MTTVVFWAVKLCGLHAGTDISKVILPTFSTLNMEGHISSKHWCIFTCHHGVLPKRSALMWQSNGIKDAFVSKCVMLKKIFEKIILVG